MGLPPTKENDYTYEEFSNHANYADNVGLDHSQPHYYYQAKSDTSVNSNSKSSSSSSFISKDLPCFDTTATTRTKSTASDGDHDHVTDDDDGIIRNTFFTFGSSRSSHDDSSSYNTNKGIQCRFGERGIITAIHYDGGKNMVGMIKVRCL